MRLENPASGGESSSDPRESNQLLVGERVLVRKGKRLIRFIVMVMIIIMIIIIIIVIITQPLAGHFADRVSQPL